MKKIILPLLICLSTLAFGQNYQNELDKLNDYLETFNASDFSYVDIDDGYLIYVYSIEELSMDISDIENIIIESNPKSVDILCKSRKDCVYSDLFGEYSDRMSFSNNGDFNTRELADMLQNLIDKYNGKTTNNRNTITTINTPSKTNNTDNALKQINDYLKTFDNGYYGSLKIENGFLIDNFKSGEYAKLEIGKITEATLDTDKSKVVLNCKEGGYCVFSTYTDTYHDQLSFSQSASYNTQELITLLNNLINSYNGKTINSISTINTPTKSNNTDNAIKQINDYLKTFDNGYYGALKIENGYLIDNFKSGKYTKVEINKLTEATVETENTKVIVKCKGGSDCVFSTYTDSYHDKMSFSQSTNFKTQELITLLNNVINSYNGKSINNINSISTINTPTKSNNTDNELKQINDYLKTFDNGYYGALKIENGYLIDNFKSGKYSKAEMSKLTEATVETENTKVVIKCKNGSDCVFSTYTDSYHGQMSFSQSSNFNTRELITLLNNLINAYNGKTTSITSVSTISNIGNANEALKKLNKYLETFDNGYYGYFEIKDGYIYDRFKAGKYNKFKMEDMEGAIIEEQYKRVIFKCKGNDCISTDWKVNGYENYTQFTSGSSFNYQELATLLNNFRDAYLNNKTSNTPSNNNSIRDTKAIDRQLQNTPAKTIENDIEEVDDEEDLSMLWYFLGGEIDDSQVDSILKTTNSNTNNYNTALKNLNDYLKIFNPETYREIEVKNGKVFFKFLFSAKVYECSIGINELKTKTSVVKGKSIDVDEIKILCNGNTKCFYSTYSNDNADHFRFFSKTVKDLSKVEQLVKEFIKAL